MDNFGWLDEQQAIQMLQTPATELPKPELQYVAAMRLGNASSPESLEALLSTAAWRGDSINERLTRRKALEALGQRPDPRGLPLALQGLDSDDPGAVMSAAQSIARLWEAGQTMAPDRLTAALLAALHGPGTQERAVIQCLTRLQLDGARDIVETRLDHPDHLVNGAARAYLVRLGGTGNLLLPVLKRLKHPQAWQRRIAVIDLGLAAAPEHLEAVVRTPVSMPLRSVAAFPLARRGLEQGLSPARLAALLDDLCIDHPNALALVGQPQPASNTPADWIQLLLQRDENCQYSAAIGILQQPKDSQAVILEHLYRHHRSDYTGHYMVMRLVGLGGHHERTQWLKDSLDQRAYKKSRIAAAVAMGELGLTDQRGALQHLQDPRNGEQLCWAAGLALALLQGQAETSLTLRAQALR